MIEDPLPALCIAFFFDNRVAIFYNKVVGVFVCTWFYKIQCDRLLGEAIRLIDRSIDGGQREHGNTSKHTKGIYWI